MKIDHNEIVQGPVVTYTPWGLSYSGGDSVSINPSPGEKILDISSKNSTGGANRWMKLTGPGSIDKLPSDKSISFRAPGPDFLPSRGEFTLKVIFSVDDQLQSLEKRISVAPASAEKVQRFLDKLGPDVVVPVEQMEAEVDAYNLKINADKPYIGLIDVPANHEYGRWSETGGEVPVPEPTPDPAPDPTPDPTPQPKGDYELLLRLRTESSFDTGIQIVARGDLTAKLRFYKAVGYGPTPHWRDEEIIDLSEKGELVDEYTKTLILGENNALIAMLSPQLGITGVDHLVIRGDAPFEAGAFWVGPAEVGEGEQKWELTGAPALSPARRL